MKNDINIPNWLLESIENKPFEALTASEKSAVAEYFSAAEYQDLRESCLLIRRGIKEDQTRGKEQVKTELMQAFEETYATVPSTVTFNTRRFIAAASLVLLALSAGLLLYSVQRTPDKPQLVEKTIHDTVQVDRTVEVIRYDTVIREKTVFVEKDRPANNQHQRQQITVPTELGLTIPDPKNLEKEMRREKTPRLSNDSLVREFGFVSL